MLQRDISSYFNYLLVGCPPLLLNRQNSVSLSIYVKRGFGVMVFLFFLLPSKHTYIK